MAYRGRVGAEVQRKVHLLLENAPDVEREVARIGDGSAVAAVGVEAVFKRGFLQELFACDQQKRTTQQDEQIKMWTHACYTEISEKTNG